MVATDEDALICDLAETYGIYNWREYPLSLVAALAFGLSDDSRIKRKMAGTTATLQNILLATIADRLALLIWRDTKDGRKGKNPPSMLLDKILQTEEPEKTTTFVSGDAFERAKRRILGG